MPTILQTSGTGYIGSHTCVELISAAGFESVLFDNLCNNSPVVIDRSTLAMVGSLHYVSKRAEAKAHDRDAETPSHCSFADCLVEHGCDPPCMGSHACERTRPPSSARRWRDLP